MATFLSSRALAAVLILALVAGGAVALSPLVAYRLPGHNQGFSPVQPIAFSHALHAGRLGIDCQYCHVGAERGTAAEVPPVGTCLNCHRFVDPNHSPELAKLYAAAGLNRRRLPDPALTPSPVAWARVHELPAFVRFDHSRHVRAGVRCQTCHGPVETMARLRQVRSLSMGMCVNCHRAVDRRGLNGHPVDASVDCVTCHY